MSFSEAARPTMRRKSSAQNLLSSFKTSSASVSSAATSATAVSTVSSSATLVYSGQQASTTPVATTPVARDWDATSLHSDAAPTPALPQGTSVEYLRDLTQKRIITLTYIRNVHEGQSHWFHTILITRSELERVFNNNDMKKRTARFAVLGMSLSNLLDINQPQDLLRGLTNTLHEYDQTKEDGDKSKMRAPKRIFKTKGGKRQGAFPEFSGYESYGDASYLMNPSTPFPLDYHQTLLALLDVLSEVYNKISKLLGPSQFPHSGHMMGPLGQLAPLPGVSYLFHNDTGIPNNTSDEGDGDGSLWGIANASLLTNATNSSGAMFGGALGSPPASTTPGFGESILKIDNKLKRIISVLLKELDQFARNAIKDELSSLDPVLRNLKIPEDGGGGFGLYDFDG